MFIKPLWKWSYLCRPGQWLHLRLPTRIWGKNLSKRLYIFLLLWHSTLQSEHLRAKKMSGLNSHFLSAPKCHQTEPRGKKYFKVQEGKVHHSKLLQIFSFWLTWSWKQRTKKFHIFCVRNCVAYPLWRQLIRLRFAFDLVSLIDWHVSGWNHYRVNIMQDKQKSKRSKI